MQRFFSCFNEKFFSIAFLLLLCLLLYSNSFNSPFIFDGITYIKENASLRNLNNLAGLFSFWPTRFVAFLSFGLNYQIHQFNLFGYHLVNLTIHMVNTLLVWWFINLLFLKPELKDKFLKKDSDKIAFLCALIFLSHPIQTQAVTYIFQRISSLACLFYLASISLYLKARLTTNKTLISVFCYSFSIISAILGMFTKETTFTLPFMLLLLEFCFLKKDKKLSLKYLIPFIIFLLIIPHTLVFTKTVYFKETGILADKNIVHLSSLHYLLTQFRVFITYIRLLFVPINQNFDYDYSISRSFFELPVLVSLFILLIILIFAIRLYYRYPLISFSIFWFFLVLLPESSIITLNDVINEHRLYLPMVGFSLFLVASIYLIFKNKPALLLAIMLTISAFYSFLTYTRNIIWQDELTFWSDVVEKSPNKARPYNGRGVAYSNKGKYDKAIADFNRALTISPGYAGAYINRGDAYSHIGQDDKAIADFTEALRIDSINISTYYNRGTIYIKKKRYENAIADFTEALKINPEDEETLNNRGVSYGYRGEYDKAIADFNKILMLNPKYPDAYYNLANVYLLKKEYSKAGECVEKLKNLGYRINPKFIESLHKSSGK